MIFTADWIWLDEKLHPEYIKTNPCSFADDMLTGPYCMADFKKTYVFAKRPACVRLTVTGSSFFRLYANGAYVGIGPAAAGGDFLHKRPAPVTYLNTYTVCPGGKEIELFAEVQLQPVVLTDYSLERGGFLLSGEAVFEDGTREVFGTDETWLARPDARFPEQYEYNGLAESGAWENAAVFTSDMRLKTAPIPMLSEEPVRPVTNEEITVPAGESVCVRSEFDRIYAGYITLVSGENMDCTVSCFEKEKLRGHAEKAVLKKGEPYRSYQMHSIGGFEIRAVNLSDRPAVLKTGLIFAHYPVTDEGTFRCGDEGLNTVYDVCKFTLKNCRQTLHLDSPMHQEPLACTGDYYIETLMTAFTFGDLRLARLDAVRTANILCANNGRMFHTSYSLIWVRMVYAVYEFTGDESLLREIEPALRLLLARFHGYLGENGLLEHAPDYMFVDWTVYEGCSMHHPPKALGQTPLCAFYHGALLTAAEIFRLLGKDADAETCLVRAASLKAACRELLFDADRGMFFDGLTTPVENTYEYLPENIDVKRFSKYGNTLAALYGLTEGEEAKAIMRAVVTDDSLGDVQPYFAHFILEALSETGLFEEYGMDLLRRWKTMTDDCAKGLKEGWFAPQKDYSFDYSHAWGGTPAYQLPAKLLGFKMLKPGFREISLSPNPMGLSDVEISMPTPFGLLRCTMRDGKTELFVPEGIRVKA